MRKRQKTLISSLAISALFAGGIAGWSLLANSPTSTTDSTSSVEAVSMHPTNLRPVQVSGTYASFQYPAVFSTAPSNPLVTPVVAAYTYHHQALQSWDLNIAIVQIPSGKLSDNNSYIIRSLDSQTYQASSIAIRDESVPVMTDVTAIGYSKVAFLVNGQYQATVSLTSGGQDDLDDLQASLELVLSSWHWQAE